MYKEYLKIIYMYFVLGYFLHLIKREFIFNNHKIVKDIMLLLVILLSNIVKTFGIMNKYLLKSKL